MKKKNKDFQKTKLKIGKKIPKRSNETNTKFKSKKIVLKDQSTLENNQMTVLSRNLFSNKQFKLLCLSKIYTNYLDKNAVDGESINILSRLLLDNEEQVRQSTIRCIKKSINKLIKEAQSINPFLTILLTYIKCGLTHIDNGVISDSSDIFAFIIDKCDTTSHQQLVLTFLPRLSVDSQVTARDFELAEKILRAVSNCNTKSDKKDHLSIKWTSEENYYDLSKLTVKEPNAKLNLSFQLHAEEDVRGNLISCLNKLIEKEIEDLAKRKSNQLTMNRDEAKKLIASVKIADILKLKRDHIEDKIRKIIVTDESIDNKSKRMKTENNQLQNAILNLLK